MMESLGIEMIFANTPQAKGRIERYNGTLQYRLPNDIIRFGIQSYNELNIWFNDFYIPYLSKKFAYIPLDPNSAFIPVDNIDFSKIFCLKYTRTIKEDMFSLNGDYYTILDRDNKPIHIINDTKVNIRVDVFTEQVYVDRYGKEHKTKKVFCRKKTKSELMENQKNVTEFLNNYRKNDTL